MRDKLLGKSAEKSSSTRRSFIGLASVFGLGAIIPSVKASQGNQPWIGSTATYEIKTEKPTTIDGQLSNVQTVKSEIVDQSRNYVTIDSIVESGDYKSKRRYVARIDAIQPKIPGAHIGNGEYRYTDRYNRDFNNNRGEEIKEVATHLGQDGAIEFVDLEVKADLESNGDQPVVEFQQSIELIDHDGEFYKGNHFGLWLNPLVIAPNEGVNLVAYEELGDDDSETDLSAQNTESFFANSEIITIDNCTADVEVWETNLSAVGNTTDFQFDHCSANGNTSTSLNWYERTAERDVNCQVMGSNYVHSNGSFYFNGHFPFGMTSEWRGEGHHTHDINQGYHHTWLDGKVENRTRAGGSWYTWRESNFYDGQQFNSGSKQSAEWHIIEEDC